MPAISSSTIKNSTVAPTTNYLVPSSGSTNAVPIIGTLTAGTPVALDWQQFNTDAQLPFQPQGVYIDNSQGTADLSIEILANGPNGALIWTVICKQGFVLHSPFPAPNGQGHIINGGGQVSIVYVDYPVLPLYYQP